MTPRLVLLLLATPAAAEPVNYVVENAASIPAPLSERPGDPAVGAELYRSAGCAACHETGEAPKLDAVADRLTEGEIRLMIVEPRIVHPATEMPAYYTPGRFGAAEPELVGRTRLSSAEIEAVIAFLLSGAAK